MTTLNNTLECLIDGIGQATGEAIKTEINNLLALPNVDITALTAAVAQIQSLLDADPDTAGYQTGQNIITQLVALGNRLDNLENSTVLAQLQVLVSDINSALVTEIADREAADHVLQTQIDTAVSSIESLQATVAALEAAGTGGGSCDCVAIAAQIATLESSLANLTGTDAAQAAQIAGLQSSLTTMAASVAAATAAANAATAAATAATAAAATATAATAALASTVAELNTRENDHHNQHHGRLNDVESFRAGIEAIDCTALVARFRSNVNVGLAG